MANTPGKVVFRNDLIELIQYAPATETVLKRPLLIVPPWINKFYVLDLNPEKSFIRWAVSQGLDGVLHLLGQPGRAPRREGLRRLHARGHLRGARRGRGRRPASARSTTIGYCVGGTLLAVALAYMAANGDDRVESATFLTTQVDFTHAGDLQGLRRRGAAHGGRGGRCRQRGYLEGSRMANAFNMLRPNDLIWPYVMNDYLKGQAPMPVRPAATGIPTRPACRPPTTPSTCATATSRTSSPRARW